jgi:DNA-binding transcriptional ArsR family regulator
MYGPLTASGLAERLGESSGATSYHLRQLEKHGLVHEDATRGNARDRWWLRRPGSISIPDARALPPGSAERLASQLVGDEWIRARDASFHEYLREADQVFDAEWLDRATFDTVNLRLTAEQLQALVTEIDEVFDRFVGLYKNSPTAGARPVQIQLNAFPLVRGEAVEGNDS